MLEPLKYIQKVFMCLGLGLQYYSDNTQVVV